MDLPFLPQLIELLQKNEIKVTCAESCTGGLLASILTEVSGSSQWFEMGFVTYSNQAKMQLLGVSDQTLQNFGAVSEQTAFEMASGARERANADYALSVTGIAGPTGGTVEKPVGTVCFGLATLDCVKTYTQHLTGNRQQIRESSVAFALSRLMDVLSYSKVP